MNTREQIKRSIKNVFLLLVLPLYLSYRIVSLFGNKDATFQSCSQVLSLIPGILGVYARAAFYRLACPETSDEIYVGFLTVFSHWDTTLRQGVYIGPQCNIGKCTIGENTLLGSGVHVLSGRKQHSFSDPEKPIREQGGEFEKIHIGSDCWLGNQATVMVNLPDKVLVAAGSVVTRPANRGDILAGNPADVVRNRLDIDKC